jgi:hypothetical protein
MKSALLTGISSLAFSVLLISCNTGEEKPLVDPSRQADSLAALDLAPAAPSNPTPAPAPVNPEPPAAVQAPVAPSAQLALNPQHGQPGHRCDIAVGAPLPGGSPAPSSGTVANVVVPATSASPNSVFNSKTNTQVQPKLAVPNTQSPLVKLNPKHGEPGHRCDLQVGAPLN